MLKMCGGRLFLGALVALSSAPWAIAVSPEDLSSQKLVAVQSFSNDFTVQYGSESLNDSIKRASSLTGIHVDSSALNPTLEMSFTSLPIYRVVKDGTSLNI